MNSYPVKTARQLGPILQGYRKMRKQTQSQVSERVGLAQKDISNLERDASRATLSRVFKVLSALDLELVVQERQKPSVSSDW